jgi:hypothetical protein
VLSPHVRAVRIACCAPFSIFESIFRYKPGLYGCLMHIILATSPHHVPFEEHIIR